MRIRILNTARSTLFIHMLQLISISSNMSTIIFSFYYNDIINLFKISKLIKRRYGETSQLVNINFSHRRLIIRH